MTMFRHLLLVASLTATAICVHAVAPPGIMHHQGRIVVNGENYNGTGYFKFYIGSPDDQFEWSNDGSSLGSDEPNNAVPVTVVNGHYAVPLGDTTFHANMNNAIPASGFSDKDELYLQVWFSTDNSTFERLLPDRRLATSAYAFSAARAQVAQTAVTAESVFDGVRGFRVQATTSSVTGAGHNLLSGDDDNTIVGTVYSSALIGGGSAFGANSINSSDLAAILGGGSNTLTFSGSSVIIGGSSNTMNQASSSVIGGGRSNSLNADNQAIVGAQSSSVGSSSEWSGIFGGHTQSIGISSKYSVIIGGQNNQIGDSSNYALAAGRRSKVNHEGTFAWADSTDADFASTGTNQFLIRAGGGVGIGTNAPGSALEVRSSNAVSSTSDNGIISATDGTGAIVIDQDDIQRYSSVDTPGTLYLNFYGGDIVLSASGQGATTTVYGTFDNLSDRESKEDFAPIDAQAVLEQLVELPVSTWRYKGAETRRHIGPVSQDFHSAFNELLNLNSPDTVIATLDEAGIAFASIQALHERMENENKRLREENTALKQRLDRLENIVEQISHTGL